MNKTLTRKKAKEYYYYFRDHKNRPIVTVCLLVNGTSWARGLALCSYKDNPCKKTGRRIARQRAKWALENKNNNCEVARDEGLMVYVNKLPELYQGLFNYCKAYYEPPFTPMEENL